jgi:hypothetical protein
MKKPLRLALALIVLALSLVLLVWAFWPQEREVRRRFIQPTEMQLPTPGSSLLMLRKFVWANQNDETACLPLVTDRFALIL